LYFYSAFGLNIASDVPLNKLIAAGELKPDVAFCFGKAEVVIDNPIIVKKTFQANHFSFAYHVADTLFYFNFLNKKLIFSYTNKQQFELYLYGPVIALISAYFGKIPLHASGLIVHDKTILIAGNSGAGKSTLLFHFIQNYQARFFSDDIVVMEKKGSIIQANPSFAEIKLWLDAIERFNANIIKPVHPDIKKYFVDVKSFFINKIQIPQVVFIIQTTQNTTAQFEKVTGVNKFLYLIKNVYRRNHIEILFKKNIFELVATLANQTQVYILHRPFAINNELWNEFVDSCLEQI